jgi:hypothetical protein
MFLVVRETPGIDQTSHERNAIEKVTQDALTEGTNRNGSISAK